MRENIIRALKCIILAISLTMFFYQAQIAVNKYLIPPVVDSTDYLNIADIEPPLITICPKSQLENWEKLEKLGYDYTKHLLRGEDRKNNITAWGAQYNMTFEELIEEIVDLEKDYPKLEFRMNNGPWLRADYERRFYPMYGRCIDFSNYTLTRDLEFKIFFKNIFSIGSISDAEIFLTDKKLRTRNTVHKPSHWGPSISIKTNGLQDYLVKVEQLSSLDPRNPEDCKEYTDDEFERCVDDELQDLWKPFIGCNPPWLSPQDQCNGMLNTSDVNNLIYNKTSETIDNILSMRNYAAKERCTKPCLVTRLNFFKNGERFSLGPGRLNLVFDDIVVKKTKMLTYNFSNFLVDIGSSLGLWFGLSVFGITDFGILILQCKWTDIIQERVLKMCLD